MDTEAIEIVKKFAELIKEHVPIIMVILYGSRVSGTHSEYSDIDVAVIVDKIENDYLEESARLYELGWKIDSRIEPVLIEKGEDDSGFYRSVMESGIPAYVKDAEAV